MPPLPVNCWRRSANHADVTTTRTSNPSHAANKVKKEEGQHQIINAPAKNTCPHCKKFQCRKPHRIDLDKCMWNKKYKGYHFKSICNKLELAFKPRHKFTAELGGYVDKEDSESK